MRTKGETSIFDIIKIKFNEYLLDRKTVPIDTCNNSPL